jgi:hypothetical protein
MLAAEPVSISVRSTYVDEDDCSTLHDPPHSRCASGDSEMGVIGLDELRCLRPLLRLRCCCGFFGFSAAYIGGRKGKA